MLIGTVCCGDTLVTLTKVFPLETKEKSTYNLTFTDMPTDKTYTKSYTGENDAMTAFAAWIIADQEAPFAEVTSALKELRDSPAQKYMP
jgi:hypothetical protein